MKKIFNTLLLASMVAICLTGCKDPSSYTISGELSDPSFEGCMVRLYGMENRQLLDSAVISDGHFTFKGNVAKCDIAFLRVNDEAGMNGFEQYLILEPGDIHLNMFTDTLYGTPLNDRFCATFTNGVLRDSRAQISALIQQYYTTDDEAQRQVLLEQYDTLAQQYALHTAAVARQALADNPDNLLGAYAIMQLLDNGDDVTYDTLNHWMNNSSSVIANYAPLRQKLEMLHNVDITSEGNPFVDIEGIDMEGNATKLSTMMQPGTLTLIDFWASWCGPCRHEISENLIRLYDKYHTRGLNIIGIDVWDTPEKHAAAVADLGIQYPQLIDTTSANAATTLYGVEGVPTLLLIGADGTILARGIRGEAIETAIKQNL